MTATITTTAAATVAARELTSTIKTLARRATKVESNLRNVEFAFGDGIVTVSYQGVDHYAEVLLNADSQHQDIRTIVVDVVNAQKILASLINTRAAAATVELAIRPGTLAATFDGVEVTIPEASDADGFKPVTYDSFVIDVHIGDMPVTQLRNAITAAGHAASQDDTLPGLNAVNIDLCADTPRVLATDRFRLHSFPIPDAQLNQEAPLPEGLTLPFWAAQRLCELLPDNDEWVVLDVCTQSGREALRFRTQGVTMFIFLTEAKFPNVASLWPHQFTSTVTVDRKEFHALARRLGKMNNALSKKIVFSLNATGLAMSTMLQGAGDGAAANARIAGTTTGDADMLNDGIVFALNPEFLADTLKAFPEDTITLCLTNPNRPIMVVNGTTDVTGDTTVEQRAILMPVRVAV